MCPDFDIIYFDMDCVIADFVSGVREMCHMDPAKEGDPDRKAKDDILFDRIGKIDHFYLRLEPIKGTMDILKELMERYDGRVEILTGIPEPYRNVPTATDDKIVWVKKYIPGDIEVHTVLRREKMGYAKGPGSILIDDMRKNIDEWVSAGGTGIFFTSPEALRTTLSEMDIL